MKIRIFPGYVLTCLIIVISLAFTRDVKSDGLNQSEIELHACQDEKMGVKFLCNPDWELKTEDNVLLMILSENPRVSFTVARSDSPVIFLKQLTNDVLQELGQYQDGFKTQMVLIDGQEAVQVIGVSKKRSSAGFSDFYLIHDLQLYSFLFLVDPKEEWTNYENLVNKVRDSITFNHGDASGG